MENYRTQFTRIIERVGTSRGQSYSENLRSTRETELAAIYPIHVVCEWIGNSPAVANKHYLKTTEANFAQAAGLKSEPENEPASSDNECNQASSPTPDIALSPGNAVFPENGDATEWAIQDSNL